MLVKFPDHLIFAKIKTMYILLHLESLLYHKESIWLYTR